jgi:hypothetical protein
MATLKYNVISYGDCQKTWAGWCKKYTMGRWIHSIAHY